MVNSTRVANSAAASDNSPVGTGSYSQIRGDTPRHARQLPYPLGPCWIYPATGLLVQLEGTSVAGGEEVAQALWYVGPGQAEIRPERLPALAAGQVRVRAIYSAISRGTEALIAAGRVPESEYQRMRAPFMGGNFPFPVKYGYATVGVVEAGPDALVGRNVFALHPHQTKFDLPAEAVVPLPADVPLSRAVLAANIETALNATWDASGRSRARPDALRSSAQAWSVRWSGFSARRSKAPR